MTNRKEVAKKLREVSTARTTDEVYVALINCIGITHDYATMFDQLADLIDPTCDMSCECNNGDEDTEEYMELIADTPEDTVACHCNACNIVFRFERGIVPDYCPFCGARVVANNDNA